MLIVAVAGGVARQGVATRVAGVFIARLVRKETGAGGVKETEMQRIREGRTEGADHFNCCFNKKQRREGRGGCGGVLF